MVSSPVLLCKTGWQQLFVTAVTPISFLLFTQAWIGKPLESCSSAGRQCLVSSPVLLCKTGWQQLFATPVTPIDICFHTSLDEKPLKSCSSAGQTVLGLFPCAALQNRLTTAFCHCSDIYWYLPFTQAWIEKTTKELQQCWTDSAWSFPCAALQNRLATAFCHCNDI